MKKTISVIIPTLNAEEQIHGLLISLKNQSVPCEIILIDSSSSDLTVRTADSLGAKSIIIRREDFDHGRTRNLGASHAAGDIMVFLTQDRQLRLLTADRSPGREQNRRRSLHGYSTIPKSPV
jgi:rhamnosyltransferase